jgi:hypothetical protein
VWVLTVGGVIGLLLAFSFESRGTLDGWDFRMGFPDAWVVREGLPHGGFRSEVNFLRWSFGILATSVFALSYAARLSRGSARQAEPVAAPDPAT